MNGAIIDIIFDTITMVERTIKWSLKSNYPIIIRYIHLLLSN